MTTKRKIQFIDKKQQVRFAITVAFFSLLFPVLFLGLSISPALSALLIGEDAAGIQPMMGEFLIFCIRHWWVALLSLFFIAMTSVLFSHLIFGPMRRFEIVLKHKRKYPDEIVVCNLRQGDYFHDFSKLLEEVLNELQAVDFPVQSTAKENLESADVESADLEPVDLDPADLDPVHSN